YGRADLHRGTAWAFARNGHQARHALRDEVEAALLSPRPAAAEPGDLAVDQAGIDIPQRLVAQPEPLHRVVAVVLDEHIGFGHELLQHLLAPRVLQVERDTPLVAIHHHEGRRLAIDVWRQHAAGIVTTVDLLDLDDLGAHVGQHQPTDGTRHDVAEVEHPHALERSCA